MRIAPPLARLALAAGLLVPGGAAAQNFGLGLNTQDNGRPIDIQAAIAKALKAAGLWKAP